MAHPKKATNEQILAAYLETGSVWRAATILGISGQSVHERLVKMGKSVPVNVFTDEERAVLRAEYVIHRDAGKLDLLAARLGRTVPFLSRQARELGLADARHRKLHHGYWKYMPEEVARGLFDKFKASSLGLGMWCRKMGYDDGGFGATMKRLWPDEWEHVIESKAPLTSMYRHGRAFEYRTRDDLRRRGYFVLRSPASKSPIDLVAIRPGAVLMVQCKRSGALPVGEWNALYDLALSSGSVPVLSSALPRGVEYRRLTGRKDGKPNRQPFEAFDPSIRSVTGAEWSGRPDQPGMPKWDRNA